MVATRAWLSRASGLVFVLVVLIAATPVAVAQQATDPAIGTVEVTVVSAEDTNPLPEVTVRLLDMDTAVVVVEAATSAEGIVRFDRLPFGLYQVSVVPPEGYVGTAGPLVRLDPDNPDDVVRFALEPVRAARPLPAIAGIPFWAFIAAAAVAAVVVEEVVRRAIQDETG